MKMIFLPDDDYTEKKNEEYLEMELDAFDVLDDMIAAGDAYEINNIMRSTGYYRQYIKEHYE